MSARVRASSSSAAQPGPESPPGSPLARRLQRPTWRDRRLVVGAVLLLGSTVLGARLLGTGDDLTPVWAARHDLAAGLVVRSSDLEVRQVRLGDVAPGYVSATSPVPPGLVVRRAVARGELLPATAVGSGELVQTRVVTVPVEKFHAPADLDRGERVDVYVTPRNEQDGSRPTLVAQGVDVVDVEDADGRFGGASAARGVAVAVPSAQVAAVVGGLARGSVDVVRIDSATP